MSTQPGDPALAVEVLPGEGAEAGRIQLTGWLDEGPNGEAPEVRIDIDGKPADQAVANGRSRQRWEWRGPRDERGISLTVPVAAGQHEVCVVAVAGDRTLRCEDVTVKADDSEARTEPTLGAFGAEDAAGDTATSSTAVAPPETADGTAPTTVAPPVTPAPSAPTTQAPPAPTPPKPPSPTAPADTSWQAQMVDMVNAERAKANLRPVTACASLTRAAQSYAELMSARNWFDHTGPDGSTLSSRTRGAGYNTSGGGWLVAENIAHGHPSVSAVMQGWMNSAGHRANILNPGLQHLGVGKAAGNYWVQDFGSGGAC
jgi:uncharacterized protein YkwD